MKKSAPQIGLEQVFSEIDVDFKDVLRLMQMIHDLSEATNALDGNRNEGWTILRICAEIILSWHKGYNLDISSISELSGVSRDTISRYTKKLRTEFPNGPAFSKAGRRSILSYDPIGYPEGKFWEEIVEIYNRNMNIDQ